MKLFKYIFSGLALALSLTGCMNFSPEAQLNDDTVWDKASNFQLFANQFYGWTHDFNASNYQAIVVDGPHSDWRSDLIAGANVNVYSAGTNSIPEKDGNYTTLYTRIYYTNLLLKHATEFGDTASIATPMAEARFFRAYCYFELVQLYGDCILLTEPADMDSPAMNATRNDRRSHRPVHQRPSASSRTTPRQADRGRPSRQGRRLRFPFPCRSLRRHLAEVPYRWR